MITMLPAAVLLTGGVQAKSWCAAPLTVHEWGVQVFSRATPQPGVPLPSWFHRAPGGAGEVPAPVRTLPVDGGERELPVIQLWAPEVYGQDIPFALEVGFHAGEVSAWYPQADRTQGWAAAHAALVQAAHLELLTARAQRQPYVQGPALPADPAAQLAWDALRLRQAASGEPLPSEQPWVAALRALPALWVERGGERERFLFYEAATRELPAVALAWAASRDTLVLTNTSAWPVHDLLVLRRAEGRVTAARLAVLAPGGDARLHLESMNDPIATLRPWLLERLVDAAEPAPVQGWSMDWDDCVVGRDPALPVTSSSGHGLYTAEAEVLLDTWQDRLFGQEGTVLLYRDDPAALDTAVPLSAYTDMHHYLVLHRAGLVLVEGL
ncbi:MAG: hypothetical protein ABIO70_30065 [Pseudomonadota bacterium]